MLDFKSSGSIRGRSESTVIYSTTVSPHIIARCFFENYQKLCQQVVELERLPSSLIQPGAKGRRVTRYRDIDSESIFDVTRFSSYYELEISGASEPHRSSYKFSKKRDEIQIAFTFEPRDIDLVMRPFQRLLRMALQNGAEQTAENNKKLLDSPWA